MTGESQSLRFAARERGHGLAQPEVFETDIGERPQCAFQVGASGEKCERLRHGHVEHIRDRFPIDRDLEYFRTITPALAIGTEQIHSREKLHFDVLEAVATARGTAPVARIETEGAGGVAALARERL